VRTFRIPVLGMHIQLLERGESALNFLPELRGRLIRGENSPRPLYGYGRRIPQILSLGKLSETFFSVPLIETPEGVRLSRRVVTDAGVAHLVDDWDNNAGDITNFNAHGNGTGTTAEAASQTALVTEVGTRVAGTKSQPTAPQIRTVATVAQGATQAITEHGIFNSTTVAGSILWDRSLFSAINVNNGDSIEFTYTLTVNSGG